MAKVHCTFNAIEARRFGDSVLIRHAMAIANHGFGFAALLVILLCAAGGNASADQLAASLNCDEQAALDPMLARAIHDARLHASYDISVSGLSSINEQQLWMLVDSKSDPHDAVAARGDGVRDVARLLLGLRRSELFAGIELVADPDASVLRLRLAEHPSIQDTKIFADAETPAGDLLAQFLGAPRVENDEGREPTNTLRFQVWRKRMDTAAIQTGCAMPAIDPGLFARLDGGAFAPGILRGGIEAGRLRALRWLRDRGYPHATVKAEISLAGKLELRIDEGRIVSFEVRGVVDSIRGDVERTLGLRPGDLFSSAALRAAVARLNRRYPEIDLDIDRPVAEAGSERTAKAETTTRSFFEQAKSGRVDLGDIYLSWAYEDGSAKRGEDPDDRGQGSAGNSVEEIAPGRFVLWLKTSRASVDLDWIQLVRHTPATGFAPGLAATLHIWDPNNLAQVAIDGAFAANTKRSSRTAAAGDDVLERMSAQEELDWLAGARVALPSIDVAELGAQIYALTDTNDAWRMSDTNSYVHSALLYVPDREYFRRAGATALATFHLFEELTLGAEVHRDRYDPLPNPRVFSVLNMNAATLPAAPTAPVELGSILVRAEWSTDPIPLLRVGKLRRHPESSLADHTSDLAPLFTTLATVEIGNHALGSDASTDFVHLITDSRFQLSPFSHALLRIRLRAAALLGDTTLPQKEEALGGWNALRGYDFKEFRGNASVLSTAELHFHFAGAFLDNGSVLQPGGWVRPRQSLGLQLFLEHIGSLEVAWRLDEKGGAVPSARALLGWDL